MFIIYSLWSSCYWLAKYFYDWLLIKAFACWLVGKIHVSLTYRFFSQNSGGKCIFRISRIKGIVYILDRSRRYTWLVKDLFINHQNYSTALLKHESAMSQELQSTSKPLMFSLCVIATLWISGTFNNTLLITGWFVWFLCLLSEENT